jgi:UTP-glucose-1-phosphate uridylyltransferase
MTAHTRRLRKAVLPVAGLGTRVLPGTKTTPKELLNVVDRPILSYIVEEAREAGIEHIVFVTGRSKGAIEDYFDHQIELEAQLLAKGKTDILDDDERRTGQRRRDELHAPDAAARAWATPSGAPATSSATSRSR